MKRELLGRLLLISGSVLLMLATAEAAVRLLGLSAVRYNKTGRIANPKRSLMLDCYPGNPRGYFDIDLRDPEVRARYRAQNVQRIDTVFERAPWAVEYRYNSQRFRGPEFPPKQPGITRVVVLGDSFTEGQGVREADTYPRLLEKLLERSGRFEVLNCGRRATDFPALFALFAEVLPLEPDILVYGMVLNDAERSAAFEARQSYLNDWITNQAVMAAAAGAARRPWQPRLFTLVSDRLEAWRVGRESMRWYQDMYGEPNREGWERTQHYLREMDRQMRARRGRFLVAVWPLLVGLDGRYPFADVEARIAAFCVSAGIAHHELRPALAGQPSASLWVHPIDMHPNELAHRLAAESLAPMILAAARSE